MEGSATDPGISAMIRLCNVLGIDKHKLLKAVEHDRAGDDNQGLEAAIERLSR